MWIAVLVLVAGSAAASMAGELSFGLKGGMITSNVTGVPDEWSDSQDYRTGFTGGVFLNYAFDDEFSVQPELLYVPKGVGASYDVGGLFGVSADANLDFLELPVLVKYTFSTGGKIRPCIFAGPSIGVSVNSDLELSAGWLSTSVDISDYTSDTDFGIVAGAGIGYETSRGLLTFDARYQRGFTDVLEDAEFEFDGETYTINVDDFKHYGFAFMLGFQF
jgi:hypothetical protein